MYFSIIIAVFIFLGLVVFGVALLLFKLKRYLGYAAGAITSFVALSPLVSYLSDKNSWFSEGGSGGVAGIAIVLLVAGAILTGNLCFWVYIVHRDNPKKI